MPYCYPKLGGYAIKIDGLPCLVSPCMKHYVVFCAFWQAHHLVPYHGFYELLKERFKKCEELLNEQIQH